MQDENERPSTKARTVPPPANVREHPGVAALNERTVTVGQLLEDDMTAVDFLVPGCIPMGNVVLISGESGSRKTWLAYELARAVASGTPWLGRPAVKAVQGKVLILNYDNPTETLVGRVRQLSFSTDMPVRVHTSGVSPKALLTLPMHAPTLKSIVDYYRPALIVVDSMRQAHKLDENSSREAAMIMSTFKEWTAIDHCTVVVIHHTGKGEKSQWHAQARGSGEIIASAGVVIETTICEDDDDKTRATWTKHQAWDIGSVKSCEFSLLNDMPNDGDYLVTPLVASSALPGEADIVNLNRISTVMREAGHPLTQKELNERTKLNPNVVARVLQILRARRHISNTRIGPTRTRAFMWVGEGGQA